MRLLGQPAAIHSAVGRQVVDTLHVAEPVPLCLGVMMIHIGVLQVAALPE